MSDDHHISQKAARGGITRRGFIKGIGATTVATGMFAGGAPEDLEAQEASVLGPGDIPVTLKVNGKARRLQIEPRVTLLDTLRNRLDLTGSKKVCDRGTCGACTVLVDGQVAYSCSMLAVEADGKEITTIEGLGSPKRMNPVQKAFVKHDGQQCGFCTPGFVVACTAFLQKHPKPTPEQVQKGLGGNLCRCGTYAGISDAVLEASKQMKGGK